MVRNFLCFLVVVPTIAFADIVLAEIEQESLGGAIINQTFEETKASMIEDGWKIGDRIQNNVLDTSKNVSGNYYKIRIEFAKTNDGVRSKLIRYEQDYRNQTVDAQSMKADLLAKYGTPYSINESNSSVRMYFSDFEGGVLPQNKIRAQCRGEIVSSGRQPLEVLARGESDLAISLGAWLNYGYDKAAESCPETLKAFKLFIESQLAPQLAVAVSPGPNGNIVRTIKWDEPSRLFERDQIVAAQEKLANQPKAKLD